MLNLDPQLMREACAVHNIPVASNDSAMRMMRKLLYMEPAEITEPVVDAILDQKTWCVARAHTMEARKLKVSQTEIERQWGVIRANKLSVDHFALDRAVYDSMSASEKKDMTILLMDMEHVYVKTAEEKDLPDATEESPIVDSSAELSGAGSEEQIDAATEEAVMPQTDGDATAAALQEQGALQTDMREKALQAAEERLKQAAAETSAMSDAALVPEA